MNAIRSGQTVVIVGASGGIGSVISKTIHDRGANVVLVGRSAEKLVSVTNGLDSDRVLIAPADTSDMKAVENLFTGIEKRFGPPDGLVISVGSWGQMQSLKSSGEMFEEQLKTHFDSIVKASIFPSFCAAKYFLDALEGGVIFNVSSHVVSDKELPGNLSYGPAKTAVHDFLKRLKFDPDSNIQLRISNIESAIVNTALNAEILVTGEMKEQAVQPGTIANWIADNFNNKGVQFIKRFRAGVIV